MSRNTEQKNTILNAFKKGYTPTAEELLIKIRKTEPEFSRATLYRNLSAFCDSGELKKVSIVGHTDRYELNTGCNYHLACEICGKLVDLDMAGAIQTPEKILDYNISYHELMFYGVCPKCQKLIDKITREEYDGADFEDEEYDKEADEESDEQFDDEQSEDEELEESEEDDE